MEKGLKLSFKVDSFRKIPNPYLKSQNPAETAPEMYIMICDVMDLPDNIPMETNPRKQSLKTDVAKDIISSLIQPEEQRNFYLLNRGLLLSADTISFNNETSVATVTFSDIEKHGDIDGGHTYEIIKQYRASANMTRGEQYVKIEVLTGVEDMFEQLAKARNYSVKVQDKSMAELEKKFDIIKDALKDQPYFDKIRYVENETDKEIDILTIVSILNMFNIERYPNTMDSSFPINSYSSKASCLKTYLEAYKLYQDGPNNPYVKMKPIMPKIIELYDYLECNVSKFYKGDSREVKQYGKVVGVTVASDKKKFWSRFFGNEMQYSTVNGLLYPVIGAFRAIVEEYDGVYRWKKDPIEVLDKLGASLEALVIQQSRDFKNNPNATGKSLGIWQSLYSRVAMYYNS